MLIGEKSAMVFNGKKIIILVFVAEILQVITSCRQGYFFNWFQCR